MNSVSVAISAFSLSLMLVGLANFNIKKKNGYLSSVMRSRSRVFFFGAHLNFWWGTVRSGTSPSKRLSLRSFF